jgi:hypothetical protein
LEARREGAEKVKDLLGKVPNKEIGASRQAVQTAVRGRFSQPPAAEQPDFSKMNAHQIEAHIKQNAGRAA